MAAVPALATALVRLGFTQDAADYITNQQGIDSLEEAVRVDRNTGSVTIH